MQSSPLLPGGSGASARAPVAAGASCARVAEIGAFGKELYKSYMDALAKLEVTESRGFFRPNGSVSAGELADQITGALKEAHDRGVQDVLVNIAAMTGFESPGPAYRRWVAQRWAETVGPKIRIAMVARSEHICPRKTGLLVAAEEGIQAHICEAEAEAIAWLDAARVNPPERRDG